MLDPVAMKNAALSACLKPLGDFLEVKGLRRTLAEYSRDEILALLDLVVVTYQDHMTIQYENAVKQEQKARSRRTSK